MTSKINCFLIGAQKAGSTTLYSWLSQHPEIDAPEGVKDFHFFSTEEYFQKGPKWFETLYKKNGSETRINAAVNYLFRFEVPERVFNYNPDAKFLVVLRDPAKRAFSAYQFFHKLDREKRSFKTALKAENSGRFSTLREKDDFAYLEHGFYYQQLERWFKYFERDRFLILLYEDLFKSPDIFLPVVFKFLNVSADFKPKLTSKNNTGSVKYKWLNKLVYGNGGLKNVLLHDLKLKHLVPLSWRGNFLNSFRDWNTKRGRSSEKITKDVYQQISSLYQDDVNQLSKLLGRDLNEIWRY